MNVADHGRAGSHVDVARAVAVVTGLTGLVVLIGWVWHLPGLSRIHPMLGTMNAHTAICFVAAGASLWFLRSEHPRWKVWLGWIFAGVVIAMSLLTLGLSFGWGFGIDQILEGPLGELFPGRMPIASALVFLAFGLALLFLNVEVRRWRPAEVLSLVAALIGLLALISYIFSNVSVFPISGRRPLAFHSVLLMIVFAFGILMARPNRGLMSLATSANAGGVVVRRMLPAAAGIPVLVGWLVIEGQRAGWYPPGLTSPYYALLTIVVLSTVIWWTAVSLQRTDVQHERAEEQIRILNAQLEQRVADRTADLEHANRELETFAYSVSHDLRAPLRAINGFGKILIEDHIGSLGREAESHVRRITAASERMGQLIDGLLSLSRVTRVPIHRASVDLTREAGDIIAELRREDPARVVDVDIQPRLRADADPNLVRIVLDNLLTNAWKFTRKAPKAKLEFGATQDRGRAVFFVRDNGAGFDMAYAKQLFGPFQRLHAAADFEGTGIGLATVRRIVERHGGRVWGEGAVGHGATFYFTI